MELFSEYSGADFSDCGKYRYRLWRRWDSRLEDVVFIGLNPSTANAETDDPTIRRVKSFAKKWGYGGVIMLNLFAIISPDPSVLLSCDDPMGDNVDWLNQYSDAGNDTIFAWGSFKQAKVESRELLRCGMFQGAKALMINSDGSPRHPLYVPGNTEPVLFQVP